MWPLFSIIAGVFYFVSNAMISTVTSEVDGLECIFYLSAGYIFCGATVCVISYTCHAKEDRGIHKI
jgi:hypothetical protein